MQGAVALFRQSTLNSIHAEKRHRTWLNSIHKLSQFCNWCTAIANLRLKTHDLENVVLVLYTVVI